MKKAATNFPGVIREIERRLMTVTDEQIAGAHLPAHTPDVAITAEMVGRRIRCLRTLKEIMENECNMFSNWKMKGYASLVRQILDLEVGEQFALTGGNYVLYDDWSIGPKKREGAEVIPLFVRGMKMFSRFSH